MFIRSCARGATVAVLAILTCRADAAGLAAGSTLLSNAYYISPTGLDTNDGRSESRPFRTFSRAFSVMPGGNTLVLLDGVYSVAAGTGIISYLGTGSGQPPSGTVSAPTEVMALHPGQVTVTGALFLGRSTRKDSYIRISGITFQGGGELYNTSYVTIKDCGFHGSFGIGTNDHDQGNSRNLIEDVWIWASGQRLIASNYRSHENVWRRVVVRGDGCGTAECLGSGNPNVGITVYDSHDVSLQNVMVVDRILANGAEPYADFATAQHTSGTMYLLGRNEWLGCLSLNAPDNGFVFEGDNTTQGESVWTLRDCIAWSPAGAGMNLGGGASNGTQKAVVQNITLGEIGETGLRLAPDKIAATSSVTNVLVSRAGNWGINSSITPTYCNVFGAAGGAYNQTTCSLGAYTYNAESDGSLKYITRIEAGSNLKGKGAGGADIGANVVNRYGADGSRFGDAGYKALTADALWPWPNEDRIKREMCEQSGVTRGFCSAPSLTRYVWEYLGNPFPLETSPQLSISDGSVAEGSTGSVNVVLTVTLSPAATSAVTVNYATINGTATAGADYSAASGALTFAAGETSKTIAVAVVGDTVDENDETFYVALSSPTNATIADGQATVTIVDDDLPAVALSINDVTVTEGNAGTTNAVLTVTLSAAATQPVSVNFATANETATAGSDYAAQSGNLAFSAGQTSKTITVLVSGDTAVEPTETFVVNLSGPAGAALADGQGQVAIVNDDTAPLPTLAIGDVTVTEGNSGTVNARFTATLSATSTSTVTVAYVTADGTANAGSDYVAKSGTLTFAAGTTQQFVDVTVNGDTTVESSETFFVNLSGASGATIADGQGQGTITNDDTAPVGSLAIGDVSVTEGNSGTVNARFTVTLSGTSASAITVAYATANGTATAGSDYLAKSGTLTFPAGTTQQFVDVTVNGDTTVEPNETMFVNLSSPSGATIADGQGQGTIVNDDAAPPPVPTLGIGDVTVAEGNGGTTIARFTATLSSASGSTVTVAYTTANGSATAGSDYVAKSGTLTFAAGTTQQTIDVTVNGDTAVEPDETFVVNLSSPSGATIADSQGQATISNDDTAPASGIPGDFNGDGQGDLLWHHQQSGDLYAWFMNGISAGSASYLTPSRFADVKWQIRGLADFNGDGRTDVLWHHQKTGELYVWMLNGTVTTAGSYLNPKSFSDTNWQIRATADFNKDGKPDILWHHQKTGDLYVWFLDGTQVTSGAYLTPSRFADTKWQIRGTFDPNKDGEPDILWHHQGTGDLYLWFMKGTTAVSGIYLTPSRFTDTRWQIVRECDFNKDGATDLLWHHQASGQLYVWYMTGTTATGGAYLNPPAFTDVNWKVMPR